MRTRAAISASLASLGILAIGWQVGAHAAGTAGSTTAGGSSGEAGTSGGTSGGTAGAGSSAGSGSSSGSTRASGAQTTYTGKTVSTRYGRVQVQITVQSGRITEVTALQLTDAEMRSQMISATAAPILRSEVLQAQSADVQTVSGATVTSEAYRTSLQAALDAAHL